MSCTPLSASRTPHPASRTPLPAALLVLALSSAVAVAVESPPLRLLARSRSRDAAGQVRVQLRWQEWRPEQTAIVVCDMWDDHYCRESARRVAEMAPTMNRVLIAARNQGVLIVHSPSGCMDVYQDTPQRKLALAAPPVETKLPLQKWCYLDESREGKLPIDDTVPCEDTEPRPAVRMFSRQIETLRIEAPDAIADNVEAYYLMRQRGIRNVIVMGVHTNMCVLGRPFGIRQLTYQGMHVALMRDMTDSMYNPALAPRVSHCRGTELVVEHIEEHWCPTLTSADFTGELPFRFGQDDRRRVVLVAGGQEYSADASLPQLAHRLQDERGWYCDVLLGRGEGADYEIPGLEAIDSADSLVLFLRRRALPPPQLAAVRRHLERGKPLVALRTTSHGFETAPVAGRETWDAFDREVLGTDYRGHGPDGTQVSVAASAGGSPLLKGVDPAPWRSSGSMYTAAPLADDCQVLLEGAQDDRREPLAWTRMRGGSRIFYTSLGHADDFAHAPFVDLLLNAVDWSLAPPATRP